MYHNFVRELYAFATPAHSTHSTPEVRRMCRTPWGAALAGWFLVNAVVNQKRSATRAAHELFVSYFGNAKQYRTACARHITPSGCGPRFALHRMVSDLTTEGFPQVASHARSFLIPRKFTATTAQHWLQTGQALRIICIAASKCRAPNLFLRATLQTCSTLFIPIHPH